MADSGSAYVSAGDFWLRAGVCGDYSGADSVEDAGCSLMLGDAIYRSIEANILKYIFAEQRTL